MAFRIIYTSFAVLLLSFLAPGLAMAQNMRCTERNTVLARVAAIDQAWVWNRYGAIQPHGMMFALIRDVWSVDGNGTLTDPGEGGARIAGKVALRPDKRPRPLVLRVNKGDCLQIELTNLLDPDRQPLPPNYSPRPNYFRTATPEHELCPPKPAAGDARDCADGHQPVDRWAGLLVTGLAPDRAITDMAQHVGGNESSLAAPGETKTYRLIAEEEGTFFAYSPAATVGSDGNGGAIHAGLFAAVTVEPAGSVWYRSQVTQSQMAGASRGRSATGQPLFADTGYAGLAMLKGREIVHTDLTAIVDMRAAKPSDVFLCLDRTTGKPLPVCGDRTKSFREFTVIFHDESGAVQAFKEFEAREDAPAAERALARSLHGVRDGFAINYGTAGAGAEVLANRKKLGPVKNCVECQMEEFFLSSWAVGDPAMIVDKPANMQASGQPFAGNPATRVYFPDDPSNVYHSYLGDRVVIRNIHAGPKEHHVFHLHAHQWLQTQGNPRSPYLDSQTIGPGGAYSYEIAYGGSGNRNLTAGDSIFHCHFYPHFAQGMWALWRVHDTFEPGTMIDADGLVMAGTRALPDGEIATGTPIPALVPLPDVAMAPMPGQVTIEQGQIAAVTGAHPGYPFYYPARAGHRSPAPPLDIEHDGGLPRHQIADGAVAVDRVTNPQPGMPIDLVKGYGPLKAEFLPEDGTDREKDAIRFHAQGTHPSMRPDGTAMAFLTNGQGSKHGAPFADPCRRADGWNNRQRHFQIGAFQYDMVLNKKGWHFPQARILALREDIEPTLKGDRLPQPLFFRVNSGDCVEVQHTNVVPLKMVRDAFQLQVPTDIIGQHIHLVKFDVQSSDGGANGFNYEDGTPAAQEVVKRIDAIRRGNRCVEGERDPEPQPGQVVTPRCLVPRPHPWFPGKTEWIGGQVTVQRWFADPQMAQPLDGGEPIDKTLETVFTHDHFGASNHQQAGLYAGLIVEPKATRWFDDVTRDGMLEELGTRADGGPTSWKAMVVGEDPNRNFREFALEYQDFQLAFTKKDRFAPQPSGPPVQINGVNMPHQVADADDGDYFGTTMMASSPSRLVKHEWLDRGCGPIAVPCAPEIVSSDDVGVMSINYRAEPLPLRLADAAGAKPADGVQGDLAHAFRSIERADTTLNKPIDQYPLVGGVTRSSWRLPTPGMKKNDPFTPMLELVEREPFRIRLLAGAHEHEHSFTINGLTWLNAPHEPNSGYRSFIGTALSEHFEFDGVLDIPSSLARQARLPKLDHLYRVGASIEDVWYGNWGLIRTYREDQRPSWLPGFEAAAKLAGGASEAGARATMARVENAARIGQDKAAGSFVAAGQEELAQLVADAGAFAKGLIVEARSQQLVVDIAAVPARDAARGFVEDEAARGATFVTDIARRRTASLEKRLNDGRNGGDGPVVRGNDAVAWRQTARRMTDGTVGETPGLIRDGYYDRAVAEASYQEMVETLLGLQLDAASYLAEGGQLLPERTPALEPAVLKQFQNNLAQFRKMKAAGPTRAFTATALATLRTSIPRLVDLTDQQSLPVCKPGAPMRYYWVAAIDAKTALGTDGIVYHRFAAGTTFQNPARNSLDRWKQVSDPSGLLYVRATDLDAAGRLRADRKVEPLILHARAGECLKVLLTNAITPASAEQKSFANLPAIQPWDINDLRTTERVGIHAQSLRKNVGTNDGINVGDNPVQTVLPGQSRVYEWYAGIVDWSGDTPVYRDIELGAVNLMPADPVKQGGKGLFGALVIQPSDALWGFDATAPEPFSGGTVPLLTRASLAVFAERGAYRDFVLIGQDDANLMLSGTRSRRLIPFDPRIGQGAALREIPRMAPLSRRAAAFRPVVAGLRPSPFIEPVRRVAQCAGTPNDALLAMCPVQDEEVDAVDAGHKALNYRSEAGWMRRVHSAAMPRSQVIGQRQHDLLSDGFELPAGAPGVPNQTPRFCSRPGDPVRMRVLFPNGHGRNHVIEVAGHQWDDQPFIDGSSRIGIDALSQWRGTRDVVGPGSNWNLLLRHGAGGSNGVAGDYAVRDLYSWGFDGGLWAVMRVGGSCG